MTGFVGATMMLMAILQSMHLWWPSASWERLNVGGDLVISTPKCALWSHWCWFASSSAKRPPSTGAVDEFTPSPLLLLQLSPTGYASGRLRGDALSWLSWFMALSLLRRWVESCLCMHTLLQFLLHRCIRLLCNARLQSSMGCTHTRWVYCTPLNVTEVINKDFTL